MPIVCYYYEYHLQMHFIDGNQLVTDPVSVLNDLIRVLKLETIDYTNMIRWVSNCAVIESYKDLTVHEWEIG